MITKEERIRLEATRTRARLFSDPDNYIEGAEALDHIAKGQLCLTE